MPRYAAAGPVAVVFALLLALVPSGGSTDDASALTSSATIRSTSAFDSELEHLERQRPSEQPPKALLSASASGPSCGYPDDRMMSARGDPVRVIFDTDFGPDVDDVGALAVLHAMADRDEAEILGVMVSTQADFDGPRAVDVVNTYYGRPDIPIGLADSSALSMPSKFTEQVAMKFESDEVPNPTATSLYRRLLSSQPDASVTIVSVGFKSNLDDLLLSLPDEHSPLNGADLVAKKVKLWVAMAGQFPDSVPNPGGGAEWNLVKDVGASIISTTIWPTPVVFSGFEIGAAIKTGGVLETSVPEDNPVREAYRLYTGGSDRESWDLTAVWYAVRGPGDFFEACPGRIEVRGDGSNAWDPTGEDHAYLSLVVSPEAVEQALDELLIVPPGGWAPALDGVTAGIATSVD